MKDSELIEKLGGVIKVAQLLGYNKINSYQRVHNWKKRGIPAKVKLEHSKIFKLKGGA